MTFVYPLLLGGLLLAGLPVLLHFLVRRKPKTLLFPAYRFLIQKKRSNTRNLRLRHLLLLLLRVLLILVVCFALARPRLFHETLGLSREKPVALVLIFDTTPSMEYKVGDQTRLDLAKKRVLELLDRLPEDCHILILDAADPAGFGREDWLRSLDKARQRIQSLALRPESAPVTHALDEAYRRFEALDERTPRVACIFSDRTKASWDSTVSPKRDTDVQVLYFDVGVDEPIDLAITHAELGGGRPSFLEGEKIPLRALVQSSALKGDHVLVVQVGGQSIEQHCHPEPGKPQTLALEIDAPALGLKPGFHQAEVRFETEGDLLPGNDRRFVTFRVLPKPRVLVLADDLKRTAHFVRVLEALNYAVTHQKAVDEKIDLNPFDAIFLIGVAAPSEKLWSNIASAGRNVCIALPGDEVKRSAYNSESAQKIMPAKVTEKVVGPPREWNLGDADWGHPFLATYRRWLAGDVEYDFVTNPRTASRYWSVEPRSEKDVVVSYAGARHPAVVERAQAKNAAKVLLLTTPLDQQREAWNNYDEKLTSYYLALTMWCARHLCAEPESALLNYQFGQKMPTVTRTLAYPKYQLVSGDFSEELAFDNDRWTADRLPKAGNYAVTGTNPAEQTSETIHRFSINIAPEESDLKRVSIDDIEAVLGKNAVVPQDRRRSIVETLNWDEPVELFPWLMIALLFFLALENLLANRFYRKTEDAT